MLYPNISFVLLLLLLLLILLLIDPTHFRGSPTSVVSKSEIHPSPVTIFHPSLNSPRPPRPRPPRNRSTGSHAFCAPDNLIGILRARRPVT
jgi:hypothetical protein